MNQPQDEQLAEQLERLAKLHAEGALSQDEFQMAKSRLLTAKHESAPTSSTLDTNTVYPSAPPDSTVQTKGQNSSPAQLDAPPSITSRHVILGAFVIFAVGVFIVGLQSANETKSGQQPAPTINKNYNSNITTRSQQPSRSVPTLPKDEGRFISAILNGKRQYQSAPNEMAQGGARSARRTAICDTLQHGYRVHNWIGQIQTLSSNTDGLGVLTLEIAPDVSVGTWNNALSDISDYTLLPAESSVFRTVAGMNVGDYVRFSGTFIPSEVDCVEESSITLQGSMQEPDFIMRFSSASPLGTETSPTAYRSTPIAVRQRSTISNDSSQNTGRFVDKPLLVSTGSIAQKSSFAPSFDCHGARIPTEKTICHHSTLAALDVKYSKRYRYVRTELNKVSRAEGNDVRNVARVFLKNRNACGTDIECISTAYQGMLAYLSSISAVH